MTAEIQSPLEYIRQSLAEVGRGDPESVAAEVVSSTRPGTQLEIRMQPDHIVAVAKILRETEMVLDCITGIDWLADEEFELIYDFFHFENDLQIVARLRIPRDPGEIESIQEVFPGANWHEREAFDLLGIRFLNHPNLIRILLPEDSDYHPLRKDFQP